MQSFVMPAVRLSAVLCIAFASVGGAQALELQDGRLQVHGFGEVQLRTIARDYQFSDGWDLTQWYNVLNVELEYDILPDGWGPIAYLAAYGRIEVRYDCVWSRACGLGRSADAFGDRAHVLPGRLSDGRSTSGEFVAGARVAAREGALQLPDHRVGDIGVSSLGPLFDATALVGPQLTDFLFGRFDDFRFGRTNRAGSTDGLGSNLIGPYLPENHLKPNAEWRDIPNPFSTIDLNPLTGMTGVGELPFRRAPLVPAGPSGSRREAQGLFYPNADFRDVIDRTDGDFDQNFREAELKWNRGASQQDEKELKELYFDIEFLDGALWARLGRQTIVWGKTELFRNQDQFNPQDLALASLPSLEESRIPLWSGRLVYSFYEVGPFEDMRLELAFNFDQYEPSDLGDCGEPYTPDAVCYLKAQGLFTHGTTALGIIGEERPPSPWNSLEGLEGGVRLEWRWERFSFAITDFYGYNDSSTAVKYTTYGRNVDPVTGRPRAINGDGPCTTGAEPDCLQPGSTGPQNALEFHPANQTLFAAICASTVGVLAGAGLPPSECLQTLFNVPGVATLIGFDLAGIGAGGGGSTALGTSQANLVGLNADPADGGGLGVSAVLTDQQEALLGCGPFYGTNCATQGIDLLNAEASVLFQSWPSFDGVPLDVIFDGPTTEAFLADPATPNPGTAGFDGGPVATRLVSNLDGQVFRTLPGARGPGDPGYDPLVDGCVDASVPGCGGASTLLHPQSGQIFRTELAALSWNLLQILAALSPTAATDPSVCSPTRPLGCDLVSAFAASAGVQNPLVSSRDRRFGRRDFTWHGGSPTLITYDKRNILGFSTDFAEDVTGTNWGIEFTWVNDTRLGDAERSVGTTEVDTYNLTISVDRPTFITFLNRNRTFFMNFQTFIAYIEGYTNSFASSGPFRVLQTFNVSTGYFQDRLNPTVTFVYDWESNSGAVLPNINYRFTERFRVIFGLGAFFGRTELDPMSITPSSLGNRVGQHAFRGTSEQALSPVRNRDEIFLRLRYTF